MENVADASSILGWVYFSSVFFIYQTLSGIDSAAIASRIVSLHIILFYINTYIFLPRFIEKGKYFKYVFSVSLISFIAYLFIFYTNEISVFKIAINNDRQARFPTTVQQQAQAFFTRPLINNTLSTLGILFVSTVSWIITREKERRQTELSIINENLESEMQFLKTQINPHFLFNALNNIYSLSYSDSSKTSEMIMKLSEMLRYVLYESSEKKVFLSQEVDYIKNFIKFQLINFEHGANINLVEKDMNGNIIIEPMLLIPFVENAFKHGNPQSLNSFININIRTNGNNIMFDIENSYDHVSSTKDKTQGIGLINVVKRLNLLYPDKHTFTVVNETNKFSVSLIIDAS
jgi:two-component system LytT family sensor kinase